MSAVAFIGLGNMGYPMAGHLSQTIADFRVYNRTQSKTQRWCREFSGKGCDNLQDAVTTADVVCLCLGRDEDVREMVVGNNGILPYLKPNALIIDHTTTSAKLSEELEESCAKASIVFADAPVSGGQQGAINGQLSIMLGCRQNDFQKIQLITAPYTKTIERMGNIGAGQKAKMVNQICVAGLIQALAEGICFAQHMELDVEQVMRVISQGAASSWQMSNRYQTMLNDEYQHGFAVNWMHKDLEICLAEAQRKQLPLPVTELVQTFYHELMDMGEELSDTSVLLKRLQSLSSN